MSEAYQQAWQASTANPEAFWAGAARAIDWFTPPTRTWDEGGGWFADGVLNTCHNALDRHVADGRGDQVALIYDSPATDARAEWTYAALLDEVGRVAAMLASLGVGKGDRVVIYMPMVPETAFAMLACARLGAIHSVVFGGFAAHELAKRIDDATPKVLLTASCGIEGKRVIAYKPLVDEALDSAAHKVERAVVLQRPQVPAAIQSPAIWTGRTCAPQPPPTRSRPASRLPPATRSISSTRPAPPACPRAWCAITAATRWRCRGR
ncbi:AMP-binding protein [Novosphingobium colocasiae]